MAATSEIIEIRAQPGFQESFISCPADIAIGGSGAGTGKSFSLLLEPLRFIEIPRYSPVIFRRTTPQIRSPGGLWETSTELYPFAGGRPRESTLEWDFSKRSKVKFSHLEYDKDVLTWQGSQIPMIGFDELTHFSQHQFFYMLSRNRSMTGINPYVRATCNPDPDSWVASFIEWWICQDPHSPLFGFPIPERAGKIRYFVKDGDEIVWGDSRAEVLAKIPHMLQDLPSEVTGNDLVKSLAFIPGNIAENKKLLNKNPQYLANLMAQDEAVKLQLLKGNWKISQDGMAIYDFIAVSDLPSNLVMHAPGELHCITADAARFGRDMAVSAAHIGYETKKIVVRTKCKTSEQVEDIEQLRREYGVGRSEVAVDQDGVGGGVVDEGGYVGFSGGAPALPPPEDPRGSRENYADLKTQCYYRYAEKVNLRAASIDTSNIWVDGVRTDVVKVGSKLVKVVDLITADLRSAKRKDPDHERRKTMNSKAEQKNLLGGRSPDFGDTLTMREYFTLRPTRKSHGVHTLG